MTSFASFASFNSVLVVVVGSEPSNQYSDSRGNIVLRRPPLVNSACRICNGPEAPGGYITMNSCSFILDAVVGFIIRC